MMGRLDRDQGQFLYCFNLEEVVPEDHLVRPTRLSSTCLGCTASWRLTTLVSVARRLIRR